MELETRDVVHLDAILIGIILHARRFCVGVVGRAEEQRRTMQQALKDALRRGQLESAWRSEIAADIRCVKCDFRFVTLVPDPADNARNIARRSVR